MRSLAKLLLCFLGTLLPLLGADDDIPSFEFSESTYKLFLLNAGPASTDPAMNIYTLDGAGPKEAMSSMEVAYWPKMKNLQTARDRWVMSITPRLTEKVQTHRTSGNANQLVMEAVVFSSNPAGQEVILHRFDRDPKTKGITTHLIRWRFLEVEGKIDDSWFRQNRERLIEELRRLELPILRTRPKTLPDTPIPPQS